LISQLFASETFIQIGDRHFNIPKDIFSSPGDSPNFFTLGFAAFFSSPLEVFPGLDRTGLLRPPSIVPPAIPSRSADVFAQLLHLLRGYPLQIQSEDHRAELLRDCRYFNLRGLEQKLIAHDISFNLERQRSEIVLRLEDVKPSGISFVPDNTSANGQVSSGWVHYGRPFVDEISRELILEIGSDPTIFNPSTKQGTFYGQSKARISALLQVITGKVTDPVNIPLDAQIKCRMDATTDLILDGKSVDASLYNATENGEKRMVPESKKRKLDNGSELQVVEWKIRTGQWRLLVRPEPGTGYAEIILVAVKIDAFTCERARNARRKFLN
jgi:hypothetical protein